jgi:hypothetical protein
MTDNQSLHQNWLKEVDDGWKLQPGNVSESVDSLYRKLFFSSHFFIGFLEPFEVSNDKIDNPGNILVNYLQIYLEFMENNRDIITETNELLKGFWALPLDVWQQQMGFLEGFPDSFFKSAEHEMKDDNDSAEFTCACEHYLLAFQNYQFAYITMTIDAVTDLMPQLQNQNCNHYSIQKICNIWIELFEKHYADFVSKDEYSHLFAEMINSWMLLIQQTKTSGTP